MFGINIASFPCSCCGAVLIVAFIAILSLRTFVDDSFYFLFLGCRLPKEFFTSPLFFLL